MRKRKDDSGTWTKHNEIRRSPERELTQTREEENNTAYISGIDPYRLDNKQEFKIILPDEVADFISNTGNKVIFDSGEQYINPPDFWYKRDVDGNYYLVEYDNLPLVIKKDLDRHKLSKIPKWIRNIFNT